MIVRELSKEELLKSLKEKIVEYHTRLKAESIAAYILQKYGYMSMIDTTVDYRNLIVSYLYTAYIKGYEVPDEYFETKTNINIEDVISVIQSVAASDINWVKEHRYAYDGAKLGIGCGDNHISDARIKELELFFNRIVKDCETFGSNLLEEFIKRGKAKTCEKISS